MLNSVMGIYKTGIWGEQAKARSQRRKEYFRNYRKQHPQSKEYHQQHPQNKEYIRNYYQENKERIKERRKQHLPNKESVRRAVQKWQNKNPEKVEAKEKARSIEIPKGQICEFCNKELATLKHHPDYSKPLIVRFACRKCHKQFELR